MAAQVYSSGKVSLPPIVNDTPPRYPGSQRYENNKYLSSQDTYSTKHSAFKYDGNGLKFLTNNTNQTVTTDSEVTLTERLRITSTGEVNIGDDYDQTTYKMKVTGTVAATNFDSLSDQKLKLNIKKIEKPIETVNKIDGVTFNWKEDNSPSMGVIAQNIEKVLPEIVSGDDTKSVNYSGLIGLLIEVVKDQQKQINELRDRLDK